MREYEEKITGLGICYKRRIPVILLKYFKGLYITIPLSSINDNYDTIHHKVEKAQEIAMLDNLKTRTKDIMIKELFKGIQ